jgi:hypothetical protein
MLDLTYIIVVATAAGCMSTLKESEKEGQPEVQVVRSQRKLKPKVKPAAVAAKGRSGHDDGAAVLEGIEGWAQANVRHAVSDALAHASCGVLLCLALRYSTFDADLAGGSAGHYVLPPSRENIGGAHRDLRSIEIKESEPFVD